MQVDILNFSNQRVGPGPIATGIRWRYTQRLSRAGEWQFDVPAAEPRLTEATPKRFLHCYDYIAGARRWLGGGALEKRQVALRGSTPEMSLVGNDVLAELTRSTVRLEINWDSPYIGAAMYTKIMESAPAGWTITVEGATPNLIARFVDESVLNALVTITNKTGQMFRLDPLIGFDGTVNFRRIKVFSAVEDSGIMATNRAAPLSIERNINACLIEQIEQQEDAWSLINQAIPFGAGTGEARFTLYAAQQWPNGLNVNTTYLATDFAGRSHGFVFNRATNTVTDVTSVTDYGNYASQVQFKEIGPISNTDADTVAAANTLLAATVEWLLNTSRPQYHYSLSVVGLRRQVYPGQSIRVVAKEMRDGRTPIDIDEDLIIQEVVNEVDTNGMRPVALTVATTREFATTDAQILAREIQKSLAYQAHPQLGPSENTISYREDIDDTYGGSFPFWLSRGTTQINSVIVRFKLDRLRSTVKSVGGTVAGSITLEPHTHTLSAHDHDVPNHQHYFNIDPGSGGATVQAFGDISGGSLVGNGLAGQVRIFTASSSGSTTSEDNSSITVGGGGDGTVDIDLSSAITAVYGIYEDPDAAYEVGDLAWTVNAVPVPAIPTSIVGGWYELDITSYIISTSTLRPISASNTVAVAVNAPAGKKVRVTAQIEIRSIVQSIAVV